MNTADQHVARRRDPASLNGAVAIKLKQVIKRRRIQQDEIAAATGMSQTAISRLVMGATRIRFGPFEHICEVIGVDPFDVLRAALAHREHALTRQENALRAAKVHQAPRCLLDDPEAFWAAVDARRRQLAQSPTR